MRDVLPTVAPPEDVNNANADEKFKLENKLFVAKQEAHDYKEDAEEMIKSLQSHKFQDCKCQWQLIPAVVKIFNKHDRFKMGPRAAGVVDRLRTERDDYKAEASQLR